ncbi:MAG TPA: PKD domain-containing protein [Vicinamibacteria bacterium]|nr:PKD domain-containing protein [Vicinamibacteria bacterium]
MVRRPVLAWVACALVAAPACRKETVTNPALSATCSAQPPTGAAPLVVTFLLGVSGAEGPFSVSVSYGDGVSGTDPDVPHTYATAGSFTASFAVTTATQSARCSTAVTVQPGPSPSPSPSSNQPPKAVFKTNPTAVGGTITGKAPLSVALNMCPSSDPEGDRLFFLMDFDGDGRVDFAGTTGAHCRTDHVYAAGTWEPTICLHDIDADGKPLHADQCRTYEVVVSP